ncbi:hypothetical protein LIER_11643 [Lithospermum erythrorhizon]|uniref:PB1 domain-containing protein n=1 Tax=Lithospermum erythrorhizon TaxID=34254 RepID=A0AAV3PNT3_LITER
MGKRKNTTKKIIHTNFAIGIDEATTPFTISEFLNFMPCDLSWSNNKSIFHLKVFWRSHLQNQPNCLQNSSPSYEVIKKIQSALQLIENLRFATLVQFWAPITAEGQRLLVTSDFPFGLSSLHKGLCSFRKHSFGYCYNIDTGDGPPGRVFLHGLPEFSPDVALYLNEEYALRDHAIQCGVWGYLALPVFEPHTQDCVGVLEFVTVMDGSYSLSDQIGKISNVLEKSGLKCTDGVWPVNIENPPGNDRKKCPLTEIEKVLEVVCNRHILPFAQTWVPIYGERAGEIMMSTTEKGSYMRAKTVYPFQKDCLRFPLQKGEGPSWSAFSSKTSSFCRDVTQLSVASYRLALSARKVNLGSCFAICLQSIHSDELFVLELYLPSGERTASESSTFLATIFESLKQQLQSFKIVLEDESEGKSSVEVIGQSTNTSVICHQNSTSIIFDSQKHKGNVMQKDSSDEQVEAKDDTEKGTIDVHVTDTERSSPIHGSPRVEASCNEDTDLYAKPIVKAVLPPEKENSGTESDSLDDNILDIQGKSSSKDFKDSADDEIVCVSTITSGNQSTLKTYASKRLKVDHTLCRHKSEPDDKKQIGKSSCNDQSHSSPQKEEGICLDNLRLQTISEQVESLLTIKATYKDDMIKFQLPLSSGMVELKDEVNKRLKLDCESIKIEYLVEENRRMVIHSDADLQTRLAKVKSEGRTTVNLFITKILHQSGSPIARTMTIKATYKGDMIKFQLPLTSGMMTLNEEVMKRLKLEVGSFEFKHQANSSLITLSSDEALQNLMNTMQESNQTTLRLLIEEIVCL